MEIILLETNKYLIIYSINIILYYIIHFSDDKHKTSENL